MVEATTEDHKEPLREPVIEVARENQDAGQNYPIKVMTPRRVELFGGGGSN